nr:MAG TPA: hypothetical protein [Bacteriophage sp.]
MSFIKKMINFIGGRLIFALLVGILKCKGV